MARIHASEKKEAEIENSKKLNIEKLRFFRKIHPNEITQQEISVLQDLVKECRSEEERIDLVWPTVERAKSAEQVGELMKKVIPSTNFWLQTFYGIDADTAEDRAFGKNIIQAMAQRDMNYTGEYGLIDYYKKMLIGTNNDYYPQALVGDPEMVSEMLKALEGTLQKRNNEGKCDDEYIIATRSFLTNYNIWDKVVKKKGDKLSLKSNYAKLTQTIQNIEIARDKKCMDSIFKSVINQNIDNSINR